MKAEAPQGGARPPDALRSNSAANLPGGQVPPSIRGEPYNKPWLLAAFAAAFLPKCVLCLAGYGLAGGAVVELCGGTPQDHSVVWFIGVLSGVGMLLLGWRYSRKTGGTLSVREKALR